jgi:hypothetical protein
MIQDYLKSPAYYKKKHIDHVLPRKITSSMLRGLVVDDMVTGSGRRFQIKVTKKDNPTLYEKQKDKPEQIVSLDVWNQAREISSAILTQKFWTEPVVKTVYQRLVSGMLMDLPVCGLIDRLDFCASGHLRLIDLKVVSPMKVKSAKSFLFNALEMGYVRQLAFYRHLLCEELGLALDKVECYLFTASFVENGLIETHAYHVDPILLREAMEEVHTVLQEIKRGNFQEKEMITEELTF